MNEGRAELQSVILQYEKQRAEAIRSKQEAEIVLPFLRAALEELDDALGQREKDVSDQDVQSRVKSSSSNRDKRKEAAQQSASRFDSDSSPVVEKEESGESGKRGFGRGSIAALLDEDEEEQQKTGTR